MLTLTPKFSASDFTDLAPTSAVPSLPLEDTVKRLFAEYTATVGNEKANLITKANNTDPSNPAKLLELQNQVGNYSLTLNMISTLVHKSVSAVDTVIKAQ